MELLEWLTANQGGEFVITMLVAMVPIIELRGAIPFGVALGLSPGTAMLASILGNVIPLPFIVVYIRRIFLWMRRRLPKLNSLVDKMEKKAHLKGAKVTRYKYLGLTIFVAIPLPGTGGWTGALVAAFLDMPLRKAVPALFSGVAIAGCVVTFLSYVVQVTIL